jgi:transglutaminase-like putative cysteine protease
LVYEVIHKTLYSYQVAVSHCHSKVWLVPRNLPGQKCLEVEFDILPKPAVVYELTDFFGNTPKYFSIQESHTELMVKVRSKVEVLPAPLKQLNMYSGMSWERARDKLSELHEDFTDIYHFKYESEHVPLDQEVHDYAARFFLPNKPLIEVAHDLMRHIYLEFEFVTGYSTVSTPLHQIIQHRKGVCQDFAHLGIACLRSHGLAARYVSGYIETVAPTGKEKLVGADASHAWFSVYLPGEGWYDFDPTNNMIPADQHITLAWGRDYSDVTPMRGVILSGGAHKLEVEVDMKRIG